MTMKPNEFVREYLPQIKIMQLATAANGSPYICTVHYYSDPDFNLYWCSLMTRRHSQEIKHNSNAAAYVLIHENTPDEDYVIGITILGKASLISDNLDPKIVTAYARKLKEGTDFETEALKPDFPHKFYRLKPEKIVLFDNRNFPENPRQEFELNQEA